MRRSWRRFVAAGVVAAAVFIAYSSSLLNGFVGDDHIYIENNPFVRDPANLRLLVDPKFYLEKHGILLSSRPVFLASLMIDRALWGAVPAGYHATNVALHAANSVWVFALASALALPPPAPLWAGIFFAVHPIQTEAVDVVSFRPDLLAAFFLFFALWLYVRARGKRPPGVAALIVSSAALYGLGLLSKEMAATLPLLVVLVEVFFPEPKGRRGRLAGALAAYGVVACGYLGFWIPRFRYSDARVGGALSALLDRWAAPFWPSPGQDWSRLAPGRARVFAPISWEWSALHADRRAWVLTVIKSLAQELRLLVWPSPLVADRAPWVARHWADLGVLPWLEALLAVAVFASLGRRRAPAAAFGAAWCLTTLLPVSNVIPLYNPVAERYLYLVAAGAAFSAAWAVARLARGRGEGVKNRVYLAAALLAAVCVWRVRARSAQWRDDRAIHLETPAGAPQNATASFARGGLLADEGRFAEAAEEYRTAVGRNPGFAEGWLGLGAAYGGLGAEAESRASYEKALELSRGNPFLPYACFAYGAHLTRDGDKAQAERMYERAVSLEPRYVEAWVNLGALLRDEGKSRRSRECYLKAVSLADPGDGVPDYSYGLLLEKMGRSSEAAREFQAALARDASMKPAHLGLSRVYARLGRRREAAREFALGSIVVESRAK